MFASKFLHYTLANIFNKATIATRRPRCQKAGWCFVKAQPRCCGERAQCFAKRCPADEGCGKVCTGKQRITNKNN